MCFISGKYKQQLAVTKYENTDDTVMIFGFVNAVVFQQIAKITRETSTSVIYMLNRLDNNDHRINQRNVLTVGGSNFNGPAGGRNSTRVWFKFLFCSIFQFPIMHSV